MPESKGRGQGGGGGRCSRGKWKLWKGGSRSAIPALFTITEEEEGQRQRDASRRKKKGMAGKDREKLKVLCGVYLHSLVCFAALAHL